jgi:hypothetical protein
VKSFRPKIIFSLFIISIALLLSSCFEIVEEVNLNSDGSGNFCYTINLSQSKLQINSMLLLDTVNGRPVPKKENIAESIDKVEAALKQENELSEIVVKRNWDEYIFSVSGKFENIAALNKTINKIAAIFIKPGKSIDLNQDNYSYTDKVFNRFYNFNLVEDYEKMSGKDKLVFDGAKYTTIYRFPYAVGTFSNSDAKISKSGKAIMLKLNVKDLITNTKTIKNSINLK